MPASDAPRIELDSTGRVPFQRGWLRGGMLSLPVIPHWEPQTHTGMASSTVVQGQWDRGVLLRGGTPKMAPPDALIMFDPTDVRTWDAPRLHGKNGVSNA